MRAVRAACCRISPARPTSPARRRCSSTTRTRCAGASASGVMTKQCSSSAAGSSGFRIAYSCARKGHASRSWSAGARSRDGCSFVNAGMVVPSHFVPLASPGMVRSGCGGCGIPRARSTSAAHERRPPRLGLEVPPRGDARARRPRGAGATRPASGEPRDLPGVGARFGDDFGLDRARHADAVQHRAWLRGGGPRSRARARARHARRGSDAERDGRARARASHDDRGLPCTTRWTAISRRSG